MNRINYGNYIIYLDRVLGEGEYGKVYYCENKKTLEKLAAKIFKQTNQNITEECKNLIKLKSAKHVINFKEYFYHKSNYYLITEFCDRTLKDFLKDYNNKIPEKLAKKLFLHMLKGMNEIHSQGLMHRDIKMDNIFIKDNIIKIGDLGFATSKYVTNSIVGTAITMSPEMIKAYVKEERRAYFYNKNVDVWGCGVVLYEMVFGCLPFRIESSGDFLENLKLLIEKEKEGIKEKFDRKVGISKNLRYLLERMLDFNEKERYTFKMIWNCKWVVEGLIMYNREMENDRYLEFDSESHISISNLGFKSELKQSKKENHDLTKTYQGVKKFFNQKNWELTFINKVISKFNELLDRFIVNFRSGFNERQKKNYEGYLKLVFLNAMGLKGYLINKFIESTEFIMDLDKLAEETNLNLTLIEEIIGNISSEEFTELKKFFFTGKKNIIDKFNIKRKYFKKYFNFLLNLEDKKYLNSLIEYGTNKNHKKYTNNLNNFQKISENYIKKDEPNLIDVIDNIKWCYIGIVLLEKKESLWNEKILMYENLSDFTLKEMVLIETSKNMYLKQRGRNFKISGTWIFWIIFFLLALGFFRIINK